MPAGSVVETRYQVHRLRISVDEPFDEFRQRYEAAVPVYDAEAFRALVRRRADWSEMVDLMDSEAPHGFLRYGESEVAALMDLAGDRGRCVAYLMGNHVTAERMYRYDPTVMMCVPLRPVITGDGDGPTSFTIDRPSSVVAAFGDERITEVGVELDRQVAALLAHLDVPVPSSLTR